MDLINLQNLKFPRFFVSGELQVGENAVITGGDAVHIAAVLRMKAGEHIVLCGSEGFEYPSEIITVSKSEIILSVKYKHKNDSEPKTYFRLFQCVPKGEKLDLIVQKATELGVSEIIPVISKRCVSRPGNKTNKISRLQKITEQAAKQSGRGIIPKVHDFTDFKTALTLFNPANSGIIFYENGGKRINEIFAENKNIDIFIGSEGGFDPEEIEAAKKAGLIPASLGRLILRAETAPIAAISILMNMTGEI